MDRLAVSTDANISAEWVCFCRDFPDKEAVSNLKSVRRKLRCLLSCI